MKLVLKNCNLEFQKFKVVIQANQLTIPKRVNENGSIFDYSTSQVPQQDWTYSAQIDVSNMIGCTVKLHSRLRSTNCYAIAFFTGTPETATLMSSASVISPSGEEFDVTATIPQGAEFLWVSCDNNDLSIFEAIIE